MSVNIDVDYIENDVKGLDEVCFVKDEGVSVEMVDDLIE